MAVDDQAVHGDILRHLALQRLVHETHHRQMAGEIPDRAESRRPGAQREDRFQPGQGLEKSVRGTKADEIVDLLRRVMILAVQKAVEGRMAEQRLAQRVPSRRQQEQDMGLARQPGHGPPLYSHVQCGHWRAALGRAVRQRKRRRRRPLPRFSRSRRAWARGSRRAHRRGAQIGDQIDAVSLREAGKAHLGARNVDSRRLDELEQLVIGPVARLALHGGGISEGRIRGTRAIDHGEQVRGRSCWDRPW